MFFNLKIAMNLTIVQGAVLWKLDLGFYHDWNRIELVASDPDYLPVSAHLEHCNVLQLTLCLRLPHRISDCWEIGIWDVCI